MEENERHKTFLKCLVTKNYTCNYSLVSQKNRNKSYFLTFSERKQTNCSTKHSRSNGNIIRIWNVNLILLFLGLLTIKTTAGKWKLHITYI